MMDAILDKRYRINNNFEKNETSKEIVYIDYSDAKWIRINEIGQKIIEKCNGIKTLREVNEEIAKDHCLPFHIIYEYCADFLKKVTDVQLLYSEDDLLQEDITDEESNSVLYPSDIWLHVTGICNLKCSYCYSDAGNQESSSLDYEKVIKLLSEIPVQYRENIIISGGEPFLYKNLIKLVQVLKMDMGFKEVRMISNGTVRHDLYKEIAEYIDGIQFSLDGTEEAIHDSSRGNGAFLKLLEGIEEAKRCNMKNICLSFTPTNINYFQLKDLPRFAYDNRIHRIHVTNLMPVGRGMDNYEHLAISDDTYKEELEKFIKEFKHVNLDILNEREFSQVGVKEENKRKFLQVTMAGDISKKVMMIGRKISCGVGSSIISVNYNGDIYACPSLHLEEYKLGDLNDDLEAVIYKGRIINASLGVENTESDCYICKYKYFCAGGCKAVSLAKNGVNRFNDTCLKHQSRIDVLIKTLV